MGQLPPPLPSGEHPPDVAARLQALLQEQPGLLSQTIQQLNSLAVRLAAQGDHLSSAAAYAALFQRVAKSHVTHRELHVAYSNAAAQHLRLGLHAEALRLADQCIGLMKDVVATRRARFADAFARVVGLTTGVGVIFVVPSGVSYVVFIKDAVIRMHIAQLAAPELAISAARPVACTALPRHLFNV